MSAKSRVVPLIIVGVVMLAAGALAGIAIDRALLQPAPSNPDAVSSYSGVDLSVSLPDKIVANQLYQVELHLEELDGRARTITGIHIDGFMLTRALQYCTTEPASSGGFGNIGVGWWNIELSVPLEARSETTIVLENKAPNAAPTYGFIRVEFNDGTAAEIPLRFEIVEP